MSITTEQAAAWFENRAASTPMPGAREMYKIAAAALRAQLEAEKNEPLTLDVLTKMPMYGKPVFVVPHDPEMVKRGWSGWCVIDEYGAEVPGVEYWSWDFNDYGKTWTAYRHEPKEATP